MNTCNLKECATTAGCAHRGPMGELCYFSDAERPLNDLDRISIAQQTVADRLMSIEDKLDVLISKLEVK
jgi:hypothetical protein